MIRLSGFTPTLGVQRLQPSPFLCVKVEDIMVAWYLWSIEVKEWFMDEENRTSVLGVVKDYWALAVIISLVVKSS